MRQNRSVWAPFGVLLFLSFLVFSPNTASGQQDSAQDWQGPRPRQEKVIPGPQVLPVPVPQTAVPRRGEHRREPITLLLCFPHASASTS